MFSIQEYSDIIVRCGSDEYHLNKCILERIPFFRILFSNSKNIDEVILDLSPTGVRDIFDYLYYRVDTLFEEKSFPCKNKTFSWKDRDILSMMKVVDFFLLEKLFIDLLQPSLAKDIGDRWDEIREMKKCDEILLYLGSSRFNLEKPLVQNIPNSWCNFRLKYLQNKISSIEGEEEDWLREFIEEDIPRAEEYFLKRIFKGLAVLPNYSGEMESFINKYQAFVYTGDIIDKMRSPRLSLVKRYNKNI